MSSFSDLLTVVVLTLFVAVVIAEILWLRKKRLERRMRTGVARRVKKSRRMLMDEAHNSLITGRAIARTLERTGTSMSGVWRQLEEAQLAFDRGNYRVCIDIVDQAKETMKAQRLAREKKGDLEKLESSAPPKEEEMLTKEYIAKKLPENFMQAKFSLTLAKDHLEECRRKAMDVGGAESVLRDAENAFDAKDYSTALKLAIKCKNMLGQTSGGLEAIPREEEIIEITEEQIRKMCQGCGEILTEGDNFCRKCGARIPKASRCEECGKIAEKGDHFCRACGNKLPC